MNQKLIYKKLWRGRKRRSLVRDAMIPRTMSTQHPDNARVPDWCGGSIIEGDAEVREAFLAFSSLGCDEAMWDSRARTLIQTL